MGKILACRVCMSTNVKLYDMFENKLSTAYEILSGYKMIMGKKLPTCVCGVCSTLLQKFTVFRETCQTTHDLLVFSYQQNHEVSTEYIKSLKFNYHPLSKLSVHAVVKEDLRNSSSTPNSTVMKIVSIDDINKRIKTDFDAIQTKNMDKTSLTTDNKFVQVISNDEINDTVKTNFDTSQSEEFNDEVEYKFVVDKDNVELNEDSIDTFPLPNDTDENLKPIVVSKFDNVFIEKILTKEQQVQEIEDRKLSYNYKASLYKCEKCFKGFISDATYKNHLVKHDLSSGRFECDLCYVRFPIRRALAHHRTKCHEREYRCQGCPYVTKFKSQATEHIKWHNGRVFVCKLCGTTFQKSSTYLSHVRKLHPSEFVCHKCGESFIGKRGLGAHWKKAHRRPAENDNSTEDEVFTCDSCNVQFKSKDALKRHIESTAGECKASRSCVYCGEDFGTSVDLRKHLMTHLSRKMCDQCPRTFRNERGYAAHVQRVHLGITNNRPSLVCEFCGKSCKNRFILATHRRTHTGETPFKCNFCPKKFSSQAYLSIHTRRHTGETPYMCDQCPKKFSNKGALNRHIRVHTGEKPFACVHCGRTFSQSNSMKGHIQAVHLKLPTPYKSKRRSKPKKIESPGIS